MRYGFARLTIFNIKFFFIMQIYIQRSEVNSTDKFSFEKIQENLYILGPDIIAITLGARN